MTPKFHEIDKFKLVAFITKTAIVHTVTYFIAGISAMILLDYGQSMGTKTSIFKLITDPWVIAGLLLQPIRGIIFAMAIYPIRGPIFTDRLGWLKLWWLLVAIGVLSTFGPAPGSIEAMIYTNQSTSIFTYVEVVPQALAFSFILYFWINRTDIKWLNWVMGAAFAIVIILPTMGLLVASQN